MLSDTTSQQTGNNYGSTENITSGADGNKSLASANPALQVEQIDDADIQW